MFLLCSMPLKWIRYCLRHCSQRDIAVRTQRSRVVQHPPDLSWAKGCDRCCFSGKGWSRQNPFAASAESILLQKAWRSAKAGPGQLWTLCLQRKGEISAVASAKLSWRVGAGEFILWLHAAAGSEVPNSYHTGERKTFLRKKGLTPWDHLVYLYHITEDIICYLYATCTNTHFCYLKSSIK